MVISMIISRLLTNKKVLILILGLVQTPIHSTMQKKVHVKIVLMIIHFLISNIIGVYLVQEIAHIIIKKEYAYQMGM